MISAWKSSLLVLWTAVFGTMVQAAPADQHEMCEEWAMKGECEANPNYMLVSCATACSKYSKAKEEIKKEVAHIQSFFDLKANDIDGKEIDFHQFENEITVLTNVASYCGRTDQHYKELVKIHKQFQDAPFRVNILAFPCNQFGKQEPGTAQEIKQFAEEHNVHFQMMEKINVNGGDAHLVYKYLKYQTDIEMIHWNFDTYFVIDPSGTVQAFTDVDPVELLDPVFQIGRGDEF